MTPTGKQIRKGARVEFTSNEAGATWAEWLRLQGDLPDVYTVMSNGLTVAGIHEDARTALDAFVRRLLALAEAGRAVPEAAEALTEEHLRDLLFQVSKPSLREWCRVHGVHDAHASEFATGSRGPGADLLKALGVERRLVFIRKEGG